MKGHVRLRSAPDRWAIVLDLPASQSGQRRRKWHAFRATKREAQRECARLIAEVGKGTYVERSKMSVAEFVASRIDQWAAAGDISPRSAERYRALARLQIAPHLGSRPLQKIARLDLEAWHTALRNTGLAARTIGQAHRVLGKALSDAERDGLVIRNMCKLQKAPKVQAGEVVIVHDVPALIEALKGTRLYVLAVTALFTGMRLGEILALRDGRVDLDRGVIQVREALEPTASGIAFKAPKTRAGRRDITLPAVVIETLREHRRELLEQRMRLGLGRLGSNDLLFASPDGSPMKPNTVSVGWSNFAARIGMPEVTFHAMRHTHASQLIASGVDIVTISKRLGHANPNVTLAIYAHLFATDDSRASAAINNALGSIR
jgi:integrase